MLEDMEEIQNTKKEGNMIERIKYMRGRAIARIKECLWDESGIGVVEIILILVVLIGLVIIFKSQLTSLVQSVFEKITSESAGI